MLPHGLGYGAAAEHGMKIGCTGEKDNWLICIVNQMELSIKQALGTGTACPELSGSECFLNQRLRRSYRHLSFDHEACLYL